MINSRIIAIDPGGTTGWATHSWMELRDEQFDRIFTCGQLTGVHHNQLDHLLGDQHVANYWIVCESFQQYRELDSPSLIAIEYIGVVKRFAQERGIRLIFQSSTQGKIKNKSFVRKEHLQKLGLWYPAHPHAMDAYGHLLTYMINHGGTTAQYRAELLLKGWK